MEPQQAVELHDPLRKQGGSGYLIRNDLILTAHHVIAPSGEKGTIGTRYHMRLIGDYEEGRTNWITEGCYLCWDNPQYDLALLKIEIDKVGFKLNRLHIVNFGQLANTQVEAKGIGFPVVQEINGVQNPEELQGFLSKYSGLKLGQLRLQVTSPIPKSPDQWQGISGTALFVNQFLVGVVIETNKSFAEKALWVTPISQIAEDPEFCALVFGDQYLSLPMVSIEGAKKDCGPLITPNRKRDAWYRFFEPVKLIGREAELKRLEEFTQRPESLNWQVLYGQHGVGKSRLAKEWLILLENLNQQWTAGFAPDDITELYELFDTHSINPTAIVIDNADDFGNDLWEFLYRAQRYSEKNNAKVRLLFLAHTDFEPILKSFERTQCLKALRESEFIEVKKTSEKTQPGSNSERIHFPGIQLLPLQNQQDQQDILISSGGTGISEDEVKKLIRDTKGLPAFLSLAGRHPQDWNKKLEDYANAIVEQAKNLFGDKNGICILMLSTLIGPIDSSVIEEFTPGAWSVKKMKQLFGSNPSISKKEIPVFEPDLLGQEVALQALSILPDSYGENLCRLLAKKCPDIFIQKTIEIWKNHANSQGILDIFGANPRSLAAQRANVLELLFNVAIEISVNCVNLPLGHLNRIRGSIYVIALLNPALPKHQYSKIIDTVLAKAPIDGISGYLLSLHSESPCRDNTLLKWASLLHAYCASTIDKSPPEIESCRLDNNALNKPFITTVLEGLRSPDLFERSFAAYLVAEAFRINKKSQPELILHLTEVKYELIRMLHQKTEAEITAAAFAISMISHEPNGKPGWRNFDEIATNRLFAIATELHVDDNTFQAVANALGNLWRSSYHLKSIRNLLDQRSQGSGREFNLLQIIKRKLISYKLAFRLEKNSVKSHTNSLIATECLRLDFLNSNIINHLLWGLSFQGFSGLRKIEIIIRISRQSGKQIIPFLQQCAKLRDAHLQAISIACLIQKRAVPEIASLSVTEFINASNINLIDLNYEIHNFQDGKHSNSINISKNVNKLIDYKFRCNYTALCSIHAPPHHPSRLAHQRLHHSVYWSDGRVGAVCGGFPDAQGCHAHPACR